MLLGTNYPLNAKPNQYNVFSNWVCSVPGAPASQVSGTNLAFTMQSNLVIAGVFSTNPVSVAVGTYNGLFQMASGVAQETAGAVTGLSVGNAGAYTGKIYLNGTSGALKGVFGIDGSSLCLVTNPLTGRAQILSMQLDLAGGSGSLTGTVTDLRDGWQSDLLAWKADLLNPTPTNFTLVIAPAADAPARSPGGYGYVKVTCLRGAATLAGALGDGTSVAGSMGFSPNGQIPLYLDLYNHTGLVLGWLNTKTSICDITWIKKANQWTNYPAGFTNEVTGKLSPFLKPQAGASLFPTSPTLLEISGGDLAAPLDFGVSIPDFTTHALVKTSGNPTNSLTVSLNSSSGLMSGSYGTGVGRATRSVYGIVLQNTSEACGFSVGTNGQTGAVQLGTTNQIQVAQ